MVKALFELDFTKGDFVIYVSTNRMRNFNPVGICIVCSFQNVNADLCSKRKNTKIVNPVLIDHPLLHHTPL